MRRSTSMCLRTKSTLAIMFVLATIQVGISTAAAGPDQAPPSRSLSPLETPLAAGLPAPDRPLSAMSCTRPWKIRFWAFVDADGRGPYARNGCDRSWTMGDRYQASACKLQTLLVRISQPGNPSNVYALLRVERAGLNLDIVHLFALCQPPPYEITLITTNPLCYTMCPNSPPTRVITQEDFDKGDLRHRGRGRDIQEVFRFWRPPLPRPSDGHSD